MFTSMHSVAVIMAVIASCQYMQRMGQAPAETKDSASQCIQPADSGYVDVNGP